MLHASIIVGDNITSLNRLPAGSVRSVVTSPPYWGLRDYGAEGQLGLEATPAEYVENLCQVFDAIWPVLADDGTLWLNLGDSYAAMRDSKASPDSLRSGDGTLVASAANRNPSNLRAAGLKHKDLVGIPWRVAFALQERGWYLRQDIIWAKPNPMPESVTDRCTKSHEYIFLLTKSPRYYFDHEAIKEPASAESIARMKRGVSKTHKNINGAPGQTKHSMNQPRDYDKSRETATTRNKRDVWTIATSRYKGAHFATYPAELITPCILAGSAEGDTILDPFSGSGTTGEVALQHGRNYVGLELNPEYAELSRIRLTTNAGLLANIEVN